MRTGQITIDGKEYTLARSLWASSKIEELPKGMGVIRIGMSILAILLEAGYKLAKKDGADPLQPPTLDDLMINHDEEDLASWKPVINSVMRGDRNLVATPPKKKEEPPEA